MGVAHEANMAAMTLRIERNVWDERGHALLTTNERQPPAATQAGLCSDKDLLNCQKHAYGVLAKIACLSEREQQERCRMTAQRPQKAYTGTIKACVYLQN